MLAVASGGLTELENTMIVLAHASRIFHSNVEEFLGISTHQTNAHAKLKVRIIPKSVDSDEKHTVGHQCSAFSELGVLLLVGYNG